MMNLFDLMTQAQNGQAMDQMARQFGLSQNQVQSAMEALMPAFSTGFKRNTSDPMGVGSFMQALSSGQHARYFEDMAAAFQPSGIQEGNGILGHLFGSKEVSRAVAAQAAQATGIGQEILKQMLPVLASTIMGGMFKQATDQMQAASAGAGNVFGQVIGQMMQQSGMAGQSSRTQTPGPMDNPFGQVLEQMFGNGQQVDPDDPDDNGRIPNPMNPDNNPMGRIFQDMLKGVAPTQEPEPEKKHPYEDLFGEMFETGRKTQEQYARSMESIFDQYLEGMKRF